MSASARIVTAPWLVQGTKSLNGPAMLSEIVPWPTVTCDREGRRRRAEPGGQDLLRRRDALFRRAVEGGGAPGTILRGGVEYLLGVDDERELHEGQRQSDQQWQDDGELGQA